MITIAASGQAKIQGLYQAVNRVNLLYQEYASLQKVSYLRLLIFYELILANRPCTQKQLCDQLRVSKTTLNYAVKKLDQQGLLSLRVSRNNRREKLLHLTPAGKAYGHQLVDPLFAIEAQAIAPVSQADLDAAEDVLGKFAQAFANQLKQASENNNH